MGQADKNSGNYIMHQVECQRSQLADLMANMASKKEYQKRLQTKLTAYR